MSLGKKRLDFGGNPALGPDPGIFNGFFFYTNLFIGQLTSL